MKPAAAPCGPAGFHRLPAGLTPCFSPNAAGGRGLEESADVPLAFEACLSDSSRISVTFSLTFWEKNPTMVPRDSMKLRKTRDGATSSTRTWTVFKSVLEMKPSKNKITSLSDEVFKQLLKAETESTAES